MDVSELRKRITRAIDEARKEMSGRRETVDAATRAYEEFLTRIGVPLLRQSAIVLKAAGQPFEVQTPAGSARLASDRSPHTFLEIGLEVDRPDPQVIGRVSVTRGRQGQIVEERPVAPGRPIAEITEEDVATFLVQEIPRLVVR